MRRQYLTLFLILLTLTACGKKGPVRPLELPLPAAPGAFEIRQRGDQFLLAWTIPTANQDGTPLTDLAGFQIFRMRFLPQEDCPDCRDTSTLWREVNLAYLQEVRRIENRLFLSDTEVEPGYAYRYRIVPVTTRGRGGAAAAAGRTFRPPPGSPQQLVATGHDRMVRLSWEAPADSGPVEGYNVYRSTEGEPPALLPITSAPVAHNFYEDFGLENGRTYFYTVRGVAGKGAESTESAPSETASANPAPGS